MSLDFNMRDLCAAPVSLRLSLTLNLPLASLSHSEVGVIAFLCWAFVGLHVLISARK